MNHDECFEADEKTALTQGGIDDLGTITELTQGCCGPMWEPSSIPWRS
jgi:hypothetical protein